jgi:hypothetical protein
LQDRVEAGDRFGGQGTERTVLQAGQGVPDRVGRQAAGGRQFDEDGASVARTGAAGDVTAAFEPVQHAGQCGGTDAGGGPQFGDGAGVAVAEVGQGVDLGGGQVEVGQFGGEHVQGGMGGTLQREQR